MLGGRTEYMKVQKLHNYVYHQLIVDFLSKETTKVRVLHVLNSKICSNDPSKNQSRRPPSREALFNSNLNDSATTAAR